MKITCQKCGRTKEEGNFYTYKDGSKCELCKDCLTMHIDNFDPDTFTWILEKFDVPYVPGEWNILRDRAFAKDPSKMNGMSVIGKYFSKMKLTQWKDYGWKDSEELQEKERNGGVAAKTEEQKKADAAFEQELQKKLANGEITEAEYKTLSPTIEQNNNIDPADDAAMLNQGAAAGKYKEEQFMAESDIPDQSKEFTDEDKQYLVLKWGRMYTPAEWLALEKNYQRMIDSFDIQDADTENTLKIICKTYLKMNQALDQGDVDGYQKLSRVYDQQRKSAKFTAAQNKNTEDAIIEAAGVITSEVERLGGKIEPWDLHANRDIVDEEMNDMKLYVKNLVYEDKALAREIEDYIKERKAQDQMKRDREEAKKQGKDYVELTDEDLRRKRESEEEQRLVDLALQRGETNDAESREDN